MLNQSTKLSGTRRVDPITLEEELIREFPDYTITYSVMTDTFKLRGQFFFHSLMYNTHKPSILESVSRNYRRLALKYNMAFVILTAILYVLDRNFGWELVERIGLDGNTFLVFLFFIGILQYLIRVIHPDLKMALEREHAVVREKMEQLLSN